MRRSIFSKFFVAFFLLFVSFSLYAKESVDYTALAQTGTLEEIEEVFKSSGELKNSTFGKNKETFLMLVLMNDRPYEIVEFLIKSGCKITSKSKDKRTAIMFAARFSSDPKVLELLIQESAITASGRKRNINAKDSKGSTAFDYVSLNQNPAVAEVLNSYAENPKQKKQDSSKNDDSEQTETSDQDTAEPAEQNAEIQQSTETSKEETASTDEFIQSVEPSSAENLSPHENTEQSEKQNDITIQEAPDSTITDESPEENTASAETAVEKNKPLINESLFGNNTADLSQDDFVNSTEYTETPSSQNTSETETSSKSYLLSQNTPSAPDVKPYTKSYLFDYITDSTPESPVEDEDKFASVKIENVDRQDKNGITLLMKAAKAGNDWDVQNLLKNGANVQLRDKDGWSALMYAVRYQNNLSIVQSLIDSGAHVRVRNKYNSTPLLMAANYSHNPQILELLLQNRNASEDEVYSAFILALTSQEGAEHVQKLKIQLFLDLGISVNRMWKGKTPLMYACQYGNSTQIIKMLIDYGARTNMQNQEGKTAFDYAGKNRSLPHDDIYWSLNSITR